MNASVPMRAAVYATSILCTDVRFSVTKRRVLMMFALNPHVDLRMCPCVRVLILACGYTNAARVAHGQVGWAARVLHATDLKV